MHTGLIGNLITSLINDDPARAGKEPQPDYAEDRESEKIGPSKGANQAKSARTD